MTEQEAIEQMKIEAKDGNNDNETAHINADAILCEFLRSLGYGELVNVYNSFDHWYS